MARKNIDVKGMSINDILNIDLDTFNKMNERELRAITSRLVSAGNKRIRRLESKDIMSPALRGLGSDRIFSTKLPKNVNVSQRVNKLRSEFSRARGFLTSKTSTATGYREYIKQLKYDISESMGISPNKLKNVQLSRVFETLHKLQESGKVPVNVTGAKGGSKGSLQARDYLIEKMLYNPNITDEYLFELGSNESSSFFETETDDFDSYYEE